MFFPVASKFQLIYMVCVDKLRLSFFAIYFRRDDPLLYRPGSKTAQVRVTREPK